MALQKVSSITISTRFGDSLIELYTGDITKLSLEDKVDIVMTSAFQSDYSEVYTQTLMGALSHNLGVSVRLLSENKEIDLRKHFSCWVSKLLPDNIPYGRLVCFERNRNSEAGTVIEQISLVFRALMPICNNHEMSIITPLLAAGMQGNSPPRILKAMVEGAGHWIQAGLPLKCLKIVLYAVGGKIREKDQEAVRMFLSLKQNWESPNKTKTSVKEQKNDVFISYHQTDESFVNQISSSFNDLNTNLKIFSQHISYHKEAVWQEEIFTEMSNSKRIIIVLTPGYIESVECLEQFNMALCCNRLQDRDIVFPFYLQTVSALPAYMQLVQYVDCRERKEGDVTLIKIKNACESLLSSQPDTPESSEDEVTDNVNKKPENITTSKQTYDVFLSYSHKLESMAKHFLNLLEEKDSELNVFYDRTDLKMGSRWQDALYGGICSSKCVVALVSKTYFDSVVCCEEYNVAAARFFAQDKMYFLPVCIADMESVSPEYAKIKMADCRTDTETKLKQIAEKVIKLTKKGIKDPLIAKPSMKLEPYQVMEENRKQIFATKYEIKKGAVCRKEQLTKPPNSDGIDCNIVMSFAFESLKYAAVFSNKMESLLPSIKCIFLSEHRDQRLQLLDSAMYIVIFVSNQYMQSSQQMEELHLALCRQRAGGDRKLVYLIQCQKSVVEPFYLQLLPYAISLDDALWKDLQKKLKKESYPLYHTVMMARESIQGSYTCILSDYLALTTVCKEIEENIHTGPGKDNPANIVSVVRMDLRNKNVSQDNVTLSECLQDVPPAYEETKSKTEELQNIVNRIHNKCETNMYEEDSSSQLSEYCHDTYHDRQMNRELTSFGMKRRARGSGCCVLS